MTQNIATQTLESLVDCACVVGQSACAVGMVSTWVGAIATGFYEGYATTKMGTPRITPMPNGMLTASLTSASALCAIGLDALTNYEQIGKVEAEVVGPVVGGFGFPTLAYIAGCVVGMMN